MWTEVSWGRIIHPLSISNIYPLPRYQNSPPPFSPHPTYEYLSGGCNPAPASKSLTVNDAQSSSCLNNPRLLNSRNPGTKAYIPLLSPTSHTLRPTHSNHPHFHPNRCSNKLLKISPTFLKNCLVCCCSE